MFCITMAVMILLPLSINAQKEGNIWCFGDSAGIDWNDPANPQFFYSSSNFRGSCASIADTNGALLFYCSNEISDYLTCNNVQFNFIYNKNHQVMENGSCLPSSAWYNEHTIFPMPSSDSLYYVFSVDTKFSIAYSIVDIYANDGLGKVVERNHVLEESGDPLGVNTYYSWSLDAVKHGNGRDWWVIAKSAGQYVQIDSIPSVYFIFLVTPDGVTITIRPAEYSTESGIDQLLFNHQGDKFYSIDFYGPLQEYNFDRCSGDLSLNRTIDDTAYFDNGIDSVYIKAYVASELSPNGRFLYISTLEYDCVSSKQYLLQFDLWTDNPIEHIDTLSASSAEEDGYDDIKDAGALRLAPDGKIYFSRGYQSCTEFVYNYTDSTYTISNTTLGVINNPDNLGAACNFEEYSFPLGTGRTYYGLPNNPDYNLQPIPECDTLVSNFKPRKQFLKTNFNIFPNPCYADCILEYKPAKEKGNITITSTTGKIVFTEKNIPVTLLQHGYEVNLSGFAKGIYTVTLVTGKNLVTKRLVKL